MNEKSKKAMSASDICKKAGISKNTLLRWESLNVIPKADKDWRGWRVFTENDLNKILEFKKKKANQNK